jgi:hypothetical protein
MLTGQRFKLRNPALAIEIVNGIRLRVTIPTRTILKVISGPIDGDQMVDVLWEGKRVRMFAVDLISRGTEILRRKARGETADKKIEHGDSLPDQPRLKAL